MKNGAKIKNLTFIALGTVLLAICSWISVAGISMQIFGIYFLIYFWGGKKAFISTLVYLLIGALGVPVFAGFGGGIGWLFGPSGGYLFGFLAVVALHIAAETIFTKKHRCWYVAFPLAFVALTACYAVGALSVYLYTDNSVYLSVFGGSFVIYGVFDTAKILFAYYIAGHMRRIKAFSS